jgi:hypothetical protein
MASTLSWRRRTAATIQTTERTKPSIVRASTTSAPGALHQQQRDAARGQPEHRGEEQEQLLHVEQNGA